MTKHRNFWMVLSLVLIGAGFSLSKAQPMVSFALVIAGIILFPHRRSTSAVLIKAVMIAALSALFYTSYVSQNPWEKGSASITFIDVGQGDSILIELSDGKNVLIDGGLKEYGSKVVSVLKEKNIRHLDLLIASHPHADHIGGLPEVIQACQPYLIIEPVFPSELNPSTWSVQQFDRTVQNLHIPRKTVRSGDILLEGNSYRLDVISPAESLQSDDLNDYSLMTRLRVGKTVFLFTADAGYTAELEMLNRNLHCDVLQAGHHGSFGSTSTAFLEETTPDYAVISVGKDNDHNLPNSYVLSRLEDYGARIYRTDSDGSVTFETDGKTISVSFEKAQE
ncbi:MAG: MBL fold metallo-hydrolase [Solobacterium sp.]|nr:MBL fold metallo-hydrolase [Solobacterium sp.]